MRRPLRNIRREPPKPTPEAVPNPLLEEWRRVDGHGTASGHAWDMRLDIATVHEARRRCVSKYAFAIPDERAIELCVLYSPLVEIGCGTGYWANLIAAAGGAIVAYDRKPPRFGDNQYHKERHEFYEVQLGTAEHVAEHPDRTLLLCWPPYADPTGYQALSAYTGNRVIYIGESHGGCTGDDQFHELLEAEFVCTHLHWIPTWIGVRDYFTIWVRNGEHDGEEEEAIGPDERL